MYVATGNGTPYDQVGDSNSVLRLSPDLQAEDRFTPANFEALSADDKDLGSTEPAPLPGGLIFQVGKEGVGYVLDGTRLGGTGGELTSSEVCEGGFGGDAVDGDTVVFSCYGSLRAVQRTSGQNGATSGRERTVCRRNRIRGADGLPTAPNTGSGCGECGRGHREPAALNSGARSYSQMWSGAGRRPCQRLWPA